MRRLNLLGALVCATIGILGCQPGLASEASMQEHLEEIAHGKSSETLKVVYSDMHGLWGGVTITLADDGAYEQTQRTRGSAAQVRRGHITREQVRDVCQLLVDQQAWQQRVPERTPVPDESRATLTIRCGQTESSIWEWYNDLAANGRLGLIRDRLVELGRRFPAQTAPN